MIILLDCPFCGDAAVAEESVSNDQSRWPQGAVVCQGCKARTKKYYDIPNGLSGVAQAEEAWNRRTP